MNTRQHIIAHAMTLLKQGGYYNWSYDHISKKVGIRKASIHYHFPNKDTLIAEVLKIYINDMFLRLENIASSNDSNVEKIQKLINLYRSNYESSNEMCLCTILSSDYQILSAEIIVELQIFYNRLQQWLIAILQQGIKAKEFTPDLEVESSASLIINTLQGLLIMSKISSNIQVFDQCIEQLFSLLKGSKLK